MLSEAMGQKSLIYKSKQIVTQIKMSYIRSNNDILSGGIRHVHKTNQENAHHQHT